MGTQREVLDRIVVVRPYRKSGNGAKGGGRKGNSGKRGTIYQVNPDGTQTMLAQEEGATWKALSRKLRACLKDGRRLIPDHVAINPDGTTTF